MPEVLSHFVQFITELNTTTKTEESAVPGHERGSGAFRGLAPLCR
jgi:hypothetical protein